MKSILNRVVVVLVVGALTSVVALAKVQKHKVTFDNDVKVNNTVVKKGTYEVKFDDQSGQFSVFNDNKVVVQTTPRLEPLSTKAIDFILHSIEDAKQNQLVTVTFGGSDKAVAFSTN